MKTKLFSLAFLFVGLRLLAVTPAPYVEVVSFSCKLTTVGSGGGSGGNGTLIVTGEGASASVSAGSNGPESGLGTVPVRPGRVYSATYSGIVNNITSGAYAISFTAPSGYDVYINGVRNELSSGTIPGTTSFAPFSAPAMNLEIRASDVSPIEAGSFSGIALGKSVSWEVGLGGLRNGRSAGKICFREKDLTNSPSSRARLYYYAPANLLQIRPVWDDPSNKVGLNQIATPQTIVDLADATNGYTLKFYEPTKMSFNGSRYVPNAGENPWKTILVTYPTSGPLTVTETQGSTVRVSALTLVSGTISSGVFEWRLQEGNASTWQRTTTHTSSVPVANERYDVVTIQTGDATGPEVTKTKYHYVTKGWGEEVTEVILNPDGDALTTSYEYWEDSAAWGNYSRIKSIKESSGNWTSYLYYDDWNKRGRLKLETHPYGDSPSTVQPADINTGDSFFYDYTADFSGRFGNESNRIRQTKTSSGSTQTGWRTTSVGLNSSTHVTTFGATDHASLSDTLPTTTEVTDPNSINPDYGSQLLSIKRPDGSQDSWAYYCGSYTGTTFSPSEYGVCFRTIVWHGTTDRNGATALDAYQDKGITSIYLLPYKSTMDVVIRNSAGLILRKETHVFTGGTSFSLLTSEDFTYDVAGRMTDSLASNGAASAIRYFEGRLLSTKDATGTEYGFTHDELGRIKTSVKKGVAALGSYDSQYDITTTYTYDGADHITQTQVSDGSASPLTLTSKAQYDRAGHLKQQIANYGSANVMTTDYLYDAAARKITVTLPGGAQKITENYLDGSLKSITGSAVVGEYMNYSVDPATGRRKTQHRFASTSSPTLSTTTNDWLGRSVSIDQPGWNGGTVTQTCYYNSLGQLFKCTQTGVADTLYTYDTLGGILRQGVDVGGTAGTLDDSSSDRITKRGWTFFQVGSSWWRRDTSSTYATANSGAETQLGKVETQISGLPNNRLSYAVSYDIYNNATVTYTDVNPGSKLTTTTTDTPDSTTNAVQIAYNGLLMSAQDTVGVLMTYGYDTLGRPNKTTDPRTGASTTIYKAGTNLVDLVKDPANKTQAAYIYDSAGRVATVTNVFSKVARYEYNDRNQKIHEWGDTTYPVEYVYDPNYGRQTHLKTYAGSGATFTGTSWQSNPGTPAFTYWEYEEATGLLKAKYDAANFDASGQLVGSPRKIAYTYTAAGQPLKRTNQRGIETNYEFETTGELKQITYSDGTPAISYSYTRLGQIYTVADAALGAGTRTFNYNLSNTLELLNEDLPASFYASRRLTATYASSGVIGRATGMQLGTAGTPAADQNVAYDYQADGRLSTVTAGGDIFSYGYVPDSHLVQYIFANSGMKQNWRAYDATRDTLNYFSNSVNWSNNVATFTLGRDDGGRITYDMKTGTMFNRYTGAAIRATTGYNDRSEVNSDVTYIGWSGTVLTGRNDGYTFDNLGNRSSASHNGNGANYTLKTNGLNQYDVRDVPGVFDVAGGAAPAAPVTVNGSSTGITRHDGYFFKAQPMTNTATAAAANLTVSDGVAYIGGGSVGTVGTAWSIAGTADFNGDGKPDILWSNGTTGERRMWLMNGTAIISDTSLMTVPLAWIINGTGDFNGDGKADILLSNTSNGDRVIWLMNGSTITANTYVTSVPVYWIISSIADFNGDGKADILLSNTTNGERAMWLMNGTTIATNAYVGTTQLDWIVSGAGDFNGDGKADVLLSNTSTGERAMWLMNGTAVTTNTIFNTAPVAWLVTGVTDFNGDGKADVLLSNTTTRDQVIWLMNGTTITTNAFVSTAPAGWQVNGTGDFNGDTRRDVLFTNTSTGERNLWYLTGSVVQLPAFVAKTQEGFTYDFDGNLTRDGHWDYTYDAENRLISMQTLAALSPAIISYADARRLEFKYDYLGRRVQKTVRDGYNGSTFSATPLSDEKFVYNGWLLIATLDAKNGNALRSSYFWGLDLSGTQQGAGGVGGLLMTKESGNTYLTVSDHMGNIHGMVTASQITVNGATYAAGTVVAEYEYDASGKTVRESGPCANLHPFRFSTKYSDLETGLVYYGQRYYSPSLGRFINQDPIAESGGLNLYGFCGNNGVISYDMLGCDPVAFVLGPGRMKYGDRIFDHLTDPETFARMLNQAHEYDLIHGSGGYIGTSSSYGLPSSGDDVRDYSAEGDMDQMLLSQANADFSARYKFMHHDNGGQSRSYTEGGKTYVVTNDISSIPSDARILAWGSNYGRNSSGDVVLGGSNAGLRTLNINTGQVSAPNKALGAGGSPFLDELNKIDGVIRNPDDFERDQINRVLHAFDLGRSGYTEAGIAHDDTAQRVIMIDTRLRNYRDSHGKPVWGYVVPEDSGKVMLLNPDGFVNVISRPPAKDGTLFNSGLAQTIYHEDLHFRYFDAHMPDNPDASFPGVHQDIDSLWDKMFINIVKYPPKPR